MSYCATVAPFSDNDSFMLVSQTSKLAVLRFTEFVNAEYGDKGVLAYSLHPGAVESDMSSTAPDEFQGGLIDKPELAAHTILWLVKERQD